jgi:MinD-like ATPase involved in chromosome partitioning or flagellar assembly
MIPPAKNGERGVIYTFYSFKGGVGRTMALANVAALLAKWGYSVLIVDWDLEAPGLERFFGSVDPDIGEVRATTPGIVDMIQSLKNGDSLAWRDCLINIRFPGVSARLSLLSAGRNGDDYTTRLHSLDFPELFDKYDLGSYIEDLREEWASEFQFVLVDSRTGVTDIGGICTVHLADVLVLLFTTTESSMNGALRILERAREAQGRLPIDRGRLLAVPVPARDESRTEYEAATRWKETFAKQFGELYSDWLPSGTTAHDAIDLLRIPYIPYWSFGERLPAVEEGTSDPAGIGHAYEILARVLAARLDWYAALEGQTLAPPPTASRRELDGEWLARHRRDALAGLHVSGLKGFMEICHFSPDSSISRQQPDLLLAATQSQVRGLGWSTGVVLDNRAEYRPRPINDGILAIIATDTPFSPGRLFTYWTLTKSGDFYTLMSLSEDHRDEDRAHKNIYYDTRMVRAAEALLHCANLYKILGAEPNAHIDMAVRYGGLQGRTLTAGSPTRLLDLEARENQREDDVSIPAITFKLGAVQAEMVDLVKKLCEPLFVIFDYATFVDAVYRQIVTDFINGKIT